MRRWFISCVAATVVLLPFATVGSAFALSVSAGTRSMEMVGRAGPTIGSITDQAAVASQLSINASTTSPQAGASVTLDGFAQYLSNSAGISGGDVRVEQSPDGANWSSTVAVTTSGSGYYSTVVAPQVPTYYRASLMATTSYGLSSSRWILITPQQRSTTLSLSISNTNPTAGDSITCTAHLLRAGTALTGVVVELESSSDGAEWQRVTSGSTNNSGDYVVTQIPVGPTYYRAVFKGDVQSKASTSSSVRVSPTLRTTSITLVGPSGSPLTLSAFTVSGAVRSSGSVVPGVPVRIEKLSGSSWQDIGGTTTDASGNYSVSVSLPARADLRAVCQATPVYSQSVSGSVLVVPHEADDEISGATIPGSWPVQGTIRDADDVRDVYTLDLAAGKVVSLSLACWSGADLSLSILPMGSTSVYAYPVASISSGSWPRVITYDVPRTGTYYVVVGRTSGAGAYTLGRTLLWRSYADIYSSSQTVVFGESVSISGAIRCDGGGSAPDSAYLSLSDRWGARLLFTELYAPNGRVSYSFQPSRLTVVTLKSVASAETAESSWSSPVTIRVRPVFSRTSASKYSVRRKAYFTVRGTVRPAHAYGAAVWVKAQRFSATGKLLGAPIRVRAYVTSSSGSTSKFSGRMRLSKAGRYSLAAYQNEDGDHSAGKATQWSSRPVIVR